MNLLLARLLLLPFSLFLNALALSIIWGWFIVPMGMMPLGLAQAAGVSLVVGYLTHQISPQKDERELPELIALVLLWPLTVLGIGWVIQLFL